MTDDNKPKKPQGLAALSPERRKQIASMGGKTSPRNFKNTRAYAVEAGRKGGLASRKRKNDPGK